MDDTQYEVYLMGEEKHYYCFGYKDAKRFAGYLREVYNKPVVISSDEAGSYEVIQ